MLVPAAAWALQLDMFDQVAGLTRGRVNMVSILTTMPAIMQVFNLAVLLMVNERRRRRWYFA